VPSPASPAGPPERIDEARGPVPGAPGPLKAQLPAPSPAPLPATINLIVPAGTLLGWSTAPAQAGAWGLLDAGDTRTIVTAAAAHPATRWCVTLTGPEGLVQL